MNMLHFLNYTGNLCCVVPYFSELLTIFVRLSFRKKSIVLRKFKMKSRMSSRSFKGNEALYKKHGEETEKLGFRGDGTEVYLLTMKTNLVLSY